MNNNEGLAACFALLVIAVVFAGWIALIVWGVRMAKRKNRSPHWMWFGIHPLGLIIVLVVMASIEPLRVCPRCAQKTKAHARICPYCQTLLDGFTPAPYLVPVPPPPPPPPSATSGGVLSDTQMLDTLTRLCNAYAADDSAEVARLEPVASRIGEELNRRGGVPEMRRMWNRLGNIRGSRTLDMHWDGIGDWRG